MDQPGAFYNKQLINSANRSLLLIVFLGLIATGLYFVNAQRYNSRILGTETSSTPSATLTP